MPQKKLPPRSAEMGRPTIPAKQSRIRTLQLNVAIGLLALLPWGAQAQQAVSPIFSNPAAIHKPMGYTHVIGVPGGYHTIYVAGQVGLDPQGQLVGANDFKTQALQAFRNLESALRAAGADFTHVVKLNMYVTDIKTQLPLLREVRDMHVNTALPPASTTVQVSGLALPNALFEVEAIAVLPAQHP